MHICSKHPFLMAITCAYKGKVETRVLLTKNEWINSNHFHKFSNNLMKLETNTEKKYSMQVMSTTTTTTTKMEIQIYKRVYAGS